MVKKIIIVKNVEDTAVCNMCNYGKDEGDNDIYEVKFRMAGYYTNVNCCKDHLEVLQEELEEVLGGLGNEN